MGAAADSTILVPLLAVTHTFIPSACISSSGGLQGLTDSQIETIKPSWSGSGPAGPALSVTSAWTSETGIMYSQRLANSWPGELCAIYFLFFFFKITSAPKGNTAQSLSCNPIKNGITQLRFTDKACENQVIISLIKRTWEKSRVSITYSWMHETHKNEPLSTTSFYILVHLQLI